MAGPFRFPNAEQVSPQPQLWPPSPLPLPSATPANGVMHDPVIPWPKAGGPEDVARPWKSLR